jgi:hypothetical protein
MKALALRPVALSGLLCAAGIAALLVGCKSPATAPAAPSPTPAAATPAAQAASAPAPAGRKVYGEALAPAEPVAITQLLASPEKYQGKPVTVEGHVRKACTRKGCWMELAAGDAPGTQGCRVTFKNYGFFVPTDSAGAKARVQGAVEVDTLSAAAVRHYEEEGAMFAGKKPDGTAPEVRLVASGVEMWR